MPPIQDVRASTVNVSHTVAQDLSGQHRNRDEIDTLHLQCRLQDCIRTLRIAQQCSAKYLPAVHNACARLVRAYTLRLQYADELPPRAADHEPYKQVVHGADEAIQIPLVLRHVARRKVRRR